MAQSIVCGGCGAEVPYGRLSCPECGEMLASVAGAVRRPTTTTAMSWPDTAAASASNGLATEPMIASAPPPPAPPSVLRDATPATMDVDVEDVDPGLTFDDEPPEGDDFAPLAADRAVPTATPATPEADAYAASLAAVRAATTSVPGISSEAAPAAAADAPERSAAPVPVPAPMSSTAMVAPAFATAAVGPATPGAYVPPVLQPAGAAAPARAWGGQNGLDAPVAATAAVAAGAAADADSDPAPATSGSDIAKASEFVGWLAIAGAVLGLVGFLLPWSSITVIGADGVGYFDRWGLAGPWHILLVIGLIAMLAAALLRHRVPLWLGTGLPGMILGGLLLGLLWPYVIGPLGGALGAVAVALGALMLIGAGIGAVVIDRHVLRTRPV